MVLLGNSRLSEKDTLKKLKEYNEYYEYRKNRFIIKKENTPANKKIPKKFEAKTFICKPCHYTTQSRKYWWQHNKTQKHKLLVPVMN